MSEANWANANWTSVRRLARGAAIAAALVLAAATSACSSFWSYDEKDYFADLARYAPAASPAALAGTPNAPAVQIAAAPAPASRLPEPIAIEDPQEVDFACADGARLRLTYSPDRQSAVAQWRDGARIVLTRDDQDGLTRYASTDASFYRAGRRIAWEGPGEVEVKAGDTLWKIAERVYGERRRGFEIAALNTDLVADPNLIYPGQRLRLPGAQRRLCSRLNTAPVM